MSHIYTDEQRQIAEEARKLLDNHYSGKDLKALLETSGRHDAAFWASCREMGWTAITIPEAHGGLGLGTVELCLVAEACGRAVCGAPFLLTSYAAAQAVVLCGDETTKRELLPLLASGERIGTIGFGEDANAVCARPTLRLENGHLSGTKPAVLAGTNADIAIVLADDVERGAPQLAIVSLDDETVRRDTFETYDNSRGFADLTFAGTPARRLGDGDAVAAAWAVLSRAAVVMAAEQLGGADRCMEVARDYANTRHAFGQPIGKFQAIKHKIAEMYVANEIARANILEAALHLDAGRPDFDALAAAARISAIDAYDFAAREGIQVHGGIGATWETDMHLHMRRARSTAGALGARMQWEDQLIASLEAGA